MQTSRLLVFAALAIGLIPAGASRAADNATPLRQTIDAQLLAAWTKEKITPAPASSDAAFLRRIYLDLTGVIPTHDQARAFLDDTAPDKRAKLIESLLASPLYARHQADVWDQVLVGRNPPESRVRKHDAFVDFLRKSFEANTPYDKIVAAMLRAEGNTVDDGAPVYLVQFGRKAEDAIESVTETFLGVQLQCARCHDHPFEPWKQVEFYEMAAFLSRLELVTVGKQDQLTKLALGEKSTGDLNFTPAKQQMPGKKGTPVSPRFLRGDELKEPELPKDFKEVKFQDNKPPPKPAFSRKEKLAEWITAKDNPYFARAAVNRIWSQYMGRGIVHPVDNMSTKNKPSHPALLDAMAQAFVAHEFNVKWLIREIVSSQAYQLASTGEVTEAMPQWFERARVRPLSAEELVESWRTATGFDEATRLSGKTKELEKNRFYGLTFDYVDRFFGEPVTGEGDFQGGLAEHLYLNNGEVTRLIATGKGSLVDALVDPKDEPAAKVDRLFLSILSRRPSDSEREKFVEYLAGDSGKDTTRLREAMWALMTCSEFRFNH
ncbi:MAG: DUF1549 and DUF1553 domain-containing protein [Phycisphaeraceae bacterium]